MNKKVLILLIPMIMLSITSFANNVVDNTITKTIEIKEVNENQISIDEKIEYLGESFLLSDVKKEKIAKPTKKIEEKKELELTTDNKEEVFSPKKSNKRKFILQSCIIIVSIPLGPYALFSFKKLMIVNRQSQVIP